MEGGIDYTQGNGLPSIPLALFNELLLSSPPPFDNFHLSSLAGAIFLCLVGILLNLLLIYSLFFWSGGAKITPSENDHLEGILDPSRSTSTSLNRTTTFLTVNIAISDILQLVTKLSFHCLELSWGAVSPLPPYTNVPLARGKQQFQGFLHQLFASVSVTFMFFIIIDPLRFLVSRWFGRWHGGISRRSLYLLAAANWILNGGGSALVPLLAYFPAFEGLSYPYVYHSSAMYSALCWSCKTSEAPLVGIVTILDAGFLIFSPIGMILIFGGVIYLSSPSTTSKSANTVQKRIAKRGMTFTIGHLIFWSYTLFAILYEHLSSSLLPVWADRIQYFLGLLSCYANPLVVFFLDEGVRSRVLGVVDAWILGGLKRDGVGGLSVVREGKDAIPDLGGVVIPPRKKENEDMKLILLPQPSPLPSQKTTPPQPIQKDIIPPRTKNYTSKSSSSNSSHSSKSKTLINQSSGKCLPLPPLPL